jgi:hypothetical protein
VISEEHVTNDGASELLAPLSSLLLVLLRRAVAAGAPSGGADDHGVCDLLVVLRAVTCGAPPNRVMNECAEDVRMSRNAVIAAEGRFVYIPVTQLS